MGPFVTSALVAVLAVTSLVQAAPEAKHKKKHKAKKPLDGPNLARDFATIQAFAQTVTSDPNDILSNWTAAGTDVCAFTGVFCDKNTTGYEAVTAIDFNGFELGVDLSLEGFLDKLTDLAVIHVNSNNFTGTFPDISGLQYLNEIDVSNNQMSGPFPEEIFKAPLTFLDLRFNEFEGELPADILTVTNLDALFLNDNYFTGPLPEAGNVPTQYITFTNNAFEGPIPASFGNMLDLYEILLSNNSLTGNVPEELCALDLNVLDVSGNANMTGELGPKCMALYANETLVIDGTGLVASNV